MNDSRTLIFRMLQGAAVSFALVLGAGYVWWAQHKAKAAEKQSHRIAPVATENEFQVLSPGSLISGSKSLQGVIVPPENLVPLPGDPQYSADYLAMSSKSGGIEIDGAMFQSGNREILPQQSENAAVAESSRYIPPEIRRPEPESAEATSSDEAQSDEEDEADAFE